MNRVVVTGLGIISSIGNQLDQVAKSLRDSCSAMVYMPQMKELGYRCCVFAPVANIETHGIPHRTLHRLSTTATYALLATLEALEDARLDTSALSNERTGVVVGSGAGGASYVTGIDAALVDPQRCSQQLKSAVVKIMNSTAAAAIATFFGVRGRTCSLSAACTTGLYNIGHAYELLQRGMMDLCICGSAEEDTWQRVGLSADNFSGMPIGWNDRPTEACRPFDRDRQGLVMSAGAGILILETLENAERRGAKIYAEVVGYGAANDGKDMFIPSGEGLQTSIELAMASAEDAGVKRIDYINAHAPGTPAGDKVEAQVIRILFGDVPFVSSTKSISGHSQGGTAAQEAVFSLLMLDRGFVAPTVNLDNVDPNCAGIRHVQALEEVPLRTVVTVNNGLGGSNACLVLRKM